MQVAPAIDPNVAFERLALDDSSWIDIARGWIAGADEVYDRLVSSVEWRQGRVWRYERWIDEPRLGAGGSIAKPGHPVLADAQTAISARYKARFDGFGLAYYRNARDSVAMHRDREMRWLDDTVVAIVTFGAQRPFLVQSRGTRDTSTARNLSLLRSLAIFLFKAQARRPEGQQSLPDFQAHVHRQPWSLIRGLTPRPQQNET